MSGSIDNQRLDGDVLSLGCSDCPVLEVCGGYRHTGGAWSCMDRCVACEASCNKVCLKRPEAFVRDLAEIGGFGTQDISSLFGGRSVAALPRYVPMVQHGRCFAEPLYAPWAAIPIRELFRVRRGRYRTIEASPVDLRRTFGLAPGTRVVFVGTGPDACIERYWKWRRSHDAPKQLAELAIDVAVVPNFSFCLEDPRPQHLANRKRTLLCAEELADAEIPVALYLQAVTQMDWEFWATFLADHPEVTHVAKEFQTGLARRERGIEAIQRVRNLEERVGRPLHLVAIGGAQYATVLESTLVHWTLIDSVPFMKAIKRRAALPKGKRIRWQSALGERPHILFDHNILAYEQWLDDRLEGHAISETQ